MGVAHHAAHLVWFERARVELLREIGASYRELEAHGISMPVREARVRYRGPARFDDLLEVEATLREMRRVSCQFHYTVRQAEGGAPVAEGEITLAFCDASGRPIRNGPDRLRALIEETGTRG
ncbi:acyl-CoA thioesterase [Candidatus Sumerlaeota bacterium]|nr:acyl-CoA thioesterase [Candidatus Sumerlaeota bacterium]